MKQLCHLLLCAVLSLSTTILYAQRNNDVDEDSNEEEMDLSRLKREKLTLAKNAPPVSVAITPLEGDAVAYMPQPGLTAGAPATGQLSVGLVVFNEGNAKLVWDKVTYRYKYNNKPQVKTFQTRGDNGLAIKPGTYAYWQNKRDYHVAGDVLYFDEPLPASITFELFFQGYAKPVTITKGLRPFALAFRLPFKAEDLEEGEFVTTSASHGGNSQVFAYDITIVGGKKGKLSNKRDGKDTNTNENIRVFGRRLYAITDGELIEYTGNNPDNSKPGVRDTDKANMISIKHGNYIVRYAHIRQGSLNPAFKVGSKVKAGDYLGMAGNSGHHTSGPHLHLCVQRDDGGITPFNFSNGYVIGRAQYDAGTPALAWSPLKGRGIPGEKSLIWPGDAAPGN
jgi:murein DD-endopeptidase MepM/ murein hydrolase activator NlpD